MGFLAQLFGKGEEPDKSCSDEVLGRMEWSEDDEAWFGEYKGAKFSVAYDRLKQPGDELVIYAREILGDLVGWHQLWLKPGNEPGRSTAISIPRRSIRYPLTEFISTITRESGGLSLTFTEARMTDCGGSNIVRDIVKGLVLIDEL